MTEGAAQTVAAPDSCTEVPRRNRRSGGAWLARADEPGQSRMSGHCILQRLDDCH